MGQDLCWCFFLKSRTLSLPKGRNHYRHENLQGSHPSGNRDSLLRSELHKELPPY
jgi:hypothetical protein